MCHKFLSTNLEQLVQLMQILNQTYFIFVAVHNTSVQGKHLLDIVSGCKEQALDTED